MDPKPAPAAAPPDSKLFGTDGVRGRAGEGWLEAGRVSALGRAVGRELRSGTAAAGTGAVRVLLGHDGRRSGPELERALAAGLLEAGVSAVSAGLLPTPGVAHLVATGDFAAGLMVSASHNPAQDNGIKLFSSAGGKLDDGAEARIEASWRSAPQPAAHRSDPVPLDPRLEAGYLDHLLGLANGLRLSGLRIGLDCANGASSRVGPALLTRLGAEVEALFCSPDGANINDGCGSTHPEALCRAVRKVGLDLGIALDGDGDRCMLVDERGELVDGDGLLTLLAAHAKARGRLPKDRIVATVMSNRGLHRALARMDVSVATVDVGDRRVVEGLRKEGLHLGGEQSGHIVFGPENHYIGDGLLTALRALWALSESGESLSALAGSFRAFPQVLVNVPVGSKPPFAQLPAVLEAVREVEAELGEDGRVLLRYSGTESLARVMVEGPEEPAIRASAERIAAALRSAIGR